MGGIGVRYLELAQRLPSQGFDVVLVSPGSKDEGVACGLEPDRVRTCRTGQVAEAFADREVAVAQGQLANDLLAARPDLPIAVDLYDPWLVENLHYVSSLGLDPYRNDHATWVLQLSRGDFFLCSSSEQRLYYLGFLTALGRVHPERVVEDPELERLLAVVPFGLDQDLPPHRPLLPERRPGERRLLFGGLYDWYDTEVVLEALELLDDPAVSLIVVRHPNAQTTPQARFADVERTCRARGWWGERVVAIDWVPAERRWDLLRDVEGLVATHRPGLETDLAMRTRFLDALASGCPAISTAGGAIARLLSQHDAGWVVPARDARALAAAIGELLAGGDPLEQRRLRGRELASAFAWDRVLAPLASFLAAPRVDLSKDRFGFRPQTRTPPDAFRFRLRRWLATKFR